MTRELAVEIATKFAAANRGRLIQATQRYDGDWCVRVELRPGLEVWTDTRETARDLWRQLPALLQLVAPGATAKPPAAQPSLFPPAPR